LMSDPHILAGILAPDETLLESNETAMEYVDAGAEEVRGELFWETPWWPDEMRSAIQRKVQKAAEGRHVQYEADLTGAEGEPYSVSGAIRPVTSEAGEVASLIVSARDITERRRREKTLRQQKALSEQTQKLAGAWEVDLRAGEAHRTEETRRTHELEPGADRTLEEAIEFFARRPGRSSAERSSGPWRRKSPTTWSSRSTRRRGTGGGSAWSGRLPRRKAGGL